MTATIDKYKSDLKVLVEMGAMMTLDLLLGHRHAEKHVKTPNPSPAEKTIDELMKKATGSFSRDYQRWYTEAYSVIRQLIPNRAEEFEQLYKGEGKRKTVDHLTYTIQDWLNGLRASINRFTEEKAFNDSALVSAKFNTQLEILRSIERRFDSTLFDIRYLIQADLFDSELEAARELNKKGFSRGAGAISGVVLEKHFAQVATNHKVSARKKHPSISDYNDLLRMPR